jgi:signal transduction histidine kinase
VGHFYLNSSDGRLFCLNETARQLLREGVPVTPAGLEQQPLLNLDGSAVTAEDLPLVAAWREGKARDGVFLLPRTGYLPQVLTWSAAPLLGPDRKVAGVSSTVVLSAHEPDYEELAGLAHDLRTPLQAMRLLVPIAQTMPRAEVLAEVLQRLRSTCDRAAAIATQLLEWCKAPLLARQRAAPDWMPLEPLLRGLVQEHETTARKKGITLSADLASAHGVEVYSNKLQLGRVVGNLLGNAVRYTAVGHVHLACEWRTVPSEGVPMLVVSVEDTGVGMSQEEQESIFQPLQRGRAGMSDAGLSDSDSGGSGLGLATVDRLVAELGLTLEVFSRSGEGSRFELLVPRDLLRQGARE